MWQFEAEFSLMNENGSFLYTTSFSRIAVFNPSVIRAPMSEGEQKISENYIILTQPY